VCKDNNHGGQRCPSDTSEARRLRRKASNMRNSRGAAPQRNLGELITPVGNQRLEELKTKAEELREKVYNAPSGPKAQAKYDARMEKAITALGVELAAEADKMAGFNSTEFQESIHQIAEKLYEEINIKMEANRKILDKGFNSWDPIADKLGLSRYRVLEEPLTEEQLALLTEEEKEQVKVHAEAQTRNEELLEEYRNVDKKYDEEQTRLHTEMNQKLTAAYQQIIASIRPVGGKAGFDVEKAGEAAQIMQETIEAHYPSDWIQKHNEQNGSEIILLEGVKRPAYSTGAVSETETVDEYRNELQQAEFTVTSENEPILEQLRTAFPDSVETVSLQSKHWLSKEPYKYVRFQYDGEEIYDAAKHGSTPPSEETGWEYKPTFNSIALPELSNSKSVQDYADFITTKRWVRKLQTNAKEIKTLAIYDKKTVEEFKENSKDNVDVQKSTAYHEFGHRVEEVLPNNILPRQEKAFLMRRAGKTEENYYEDMVGTGAPNEYGHEGRFVEKYVGRDYFADKNFEVFTTGIEALYGGGYGGLVGNSHDFTRKDLDHRGFVLGTLATL
jgi:hypothetical protein